MVVQDVFTFDQWIVLGLSILLVFVEPFGQSFYNFWHMESFPMFDKTLLEMKDPAEQANKAAADVAVSRAGMFRRADRLFYHWLHPIIYVICQTFTVSSLFILWTEYSALVNLHHESTYTLLMAFAFASIFVSKLYPLMMHWVLYDGWKVISGIAALLIMGTVFTTNILLGIKDTDPRVGVAAGLWIPFSLYTVMMFIWVCVALSRKIQIATKGV